MHYAPVFVLASVAAFAALVLPGVPAVQAADSNPADPFRTADRCLTCHNGLRTSKGEDVSIGAEWRASVMANSARDPYWQGSVRRETLDHPESSAEIQSECSTCHMPAQHLVDRMQSRETDVLTRFPFKRDSKVDAAAADGVTCTVCHQIKSDGLGAPATYNGNVAVAGLDEHNRVVYGPYAPDPAHVTTMHASIAGYALVEAAHMRDAGLCGSCHTLYTIARGPGGKQIGRLPEQMPYLEWLHSSYRDTETCQQCHMPAVDEPVKIASILSAPRDGVHRHSFVGSNFLLEGMLDAHRDELAVPASTAELAAATAGTTAFLQSHAARVTVAAPRLEGSSLLFSVQVENLTGHKLPTAYPSRRAWLHVLVTDASGRAVFESGKLNPDGSIAGNLNDTDPARFSPHYTKIDTPDQVQIFEPILGDAEGHVTTGLTSATQYLKDNRILPAGFDQKIASSDIAVRGEAASDPDFAAGSATTHYAVPVSAGAGPFHVSAELDYQPIGYRWAHNLANYQSDEPQRFVRYYDQAAARSAVVLAHGEAATN